jgi:phage terminase large subunit-like protein
MVDLCEWAESPYGYHVDRRWQDGRWVLERGPIRLAEYHADILRHCFTPTADGRLPYDVVAWCEPAKSGKSAIAGLCAEYAALHLDGDVILASNKRNQAASLMYKSLTDSIEYNAHLPNVEPNRYEVEFSNGNTVKAIASNSRSEAGARFSLALFDELWGYFYQDSTRLWAEFKNDPTRQASVKMCVGYGGYLESELWLEILRAGMGEPVPELAHIEDGRGAPACWRNGRQFTFWSHTCRQPWQTPEWVESQRASLRPPQFARMILADFAESEGGFLPAGVWESCVDRDLLPLMPGTGIPVYLGVDLAVKPGGDDAALLALYEHGDRIAVAFHQLWKGGKARRQDLQIGKTVKPAILAACRGYNVQGIGVDPWQMMGLAQDLARAGLPVVEVAQNHTTRALADTVLHDLARYRHLALYDDRDLVAAAGAASAKEVNNGLLYITKRGRGKIDLLVAMSNAIFAMSVPRYTYEYVDLIRPI